MLETPFPFFISKIPGEILIFGTFLAKKSILAYIFHWKSTFSDTLLRHCDFIRWPIFMILVSMERKDSTHNTMVPNNCTLCMPISNSQGVVTIPLGRRVTRKASERRGLNNKAFGIFFSNPLKSFHTSPRFSDSNNRGCQSFLKLNKGIYI